MKANLRWGIVVLALLALVAGVVAIPRLLSASRKDQGAAAKSFYEIPSPRPPKQRRPHTQGDIVGRRAIGGSGATDPGDFIAKPQFITTHPQAPSASGDTKRTTSVGEAAGKAHAVSGSGAVDPGDFIAKPTPTPLPSAQ